MLTYGGVGARYKACVTRSPYISQYLMFTCKYNYYIATMVTTRINFLLPCRNVIMSHSKNYTVMTCVQCVRCFFKMILEHLEL